MGNRHRAAFVAAFLGIFLIGILGFKVWHGMGNSYETVETLSGQEKEAGLVGEATEDPAGGEDTAGDGGCAGFENTRLPFSPPPFREALQGDICPQIFAAE